MGSSAEEGRSNRDSKFQSPLGATILLKQLDDVSLWRGDHVAIRQIVEDFAR